MKGDAKGIDARTAALRSELTAVRGSSLHSHLLED